MPIPLNSADTWVYPEARREPLVETLHGVKVADPYRWMEDIDAPETVAWVKSQQQLADGFLSKLPRREALRDRLTQVFDYDKHGLPSRHGGRLFYSKRIGLQNQSTYFWREDQPDAEEKLLLDANTLSEDGTVSVAGTSVSDDGKFFAYGLSESGSDWETWHVIDVETGEKLPDVIRWVKFSGASWAHDSSGFYYSRYAEPEPGQALKDTNLNQKLYFHRLGDDQKDDRLIYERPDHPKWGFGAGVTDDGRYLVIHVWESAGSKNGLFYRDLSLGEDAPMVELFADLDASYDLIGNEGSTWFILTDRDAPKGRLVAVDLTKPAPEHWESILLETDDRLQSVSYLGGRFITSYLVNAHDEIKLFDREGDPVGNVDIPGLPSIGGFRGRQDDKETFYMVTSFTAPGAIYRYEVNTNRSTLFWEPAFPVALDSYVTEQIFATSKDGTRVPIFVTHHKDAPRDGTQPTLLTGYGGFNISLTPSFSSSMTVWLEQGGIFAVANLRGGGEFGEKWHEAGQKENKQNVFDDFIAAAEHLIAKKYTSPETLVIQGGSNGGLLVAAVVNQRPELFAAAAPGVGVMDMLRFHKFTIGWAWQDEYGNADNEANFRHLLAYSPYHNLRANRPLPPLLILTADHDDRVFPAHSFKYGAAAQHLQIGPDPVLMRIETKAGHGAGTPTDKIIESTADQFAFFLHFANRQKDAKPTPH